MTNEQDGAGVVRDKMTPWGAVARAADGEINIIEAPEGTMVAVLPLRSPWVNGLYDALKEQEADDE